MGCLHEIANFSVIKTFSLKSKNVDLIRFTQSYSSVNFRSNGLIFGSRIISLNI